MIEFLGLPPFLRIALPVAMETMHFHIAQANLFSRQLCFALRGYRLIIWHQLEIVLGYKVVKLDDGLIFMIFHQNKLSFEKKGR